MSMSEEHREAIKAANRRRGNCPQCGGSSVGRKDGKDVGGMPGIIYKVCNGCGWTSSVTKRNTKYDF